MGWPKCACDGCEEPATFNVFWPGKTMKQCAKHAERASGIGCAMGFVVPMSLIIIETLTCFYCEKETVPANLLPIDCPSCGEHLTKPMKEMTPDEVVKAVERKNKPKYLLAC